MNCKESADGVSASVEVDRDTDGELLIDWSPGSGRMVTLSLRADGRLSYAFTWDGEKSHGTAQMPAAGVTAAHPFTAKQKGLVAGDGQPCPNDHDPDCRYPDCNCRRPWALGVDLPEGTKHG